jgi:chromate transport protein ChrA
MADLLELFWRWLLIGALAFGGGQAALSLVERTVVVDTRRGSQQRQGRKMLTVGDLAHRAA